MPYPNEHSCRLRPPTGYVRYARDNDHDPNHIYGIKPDNKSELQAFRYPKDRWTTGRAREHCKKNEGTFEPAGEVQGAEMLNYWAERLLLTDPKKWYLVIPEGQYEHPTYGHLDFSEEFLQELIDNFYGKALGNTEPFVDIGHNEEEAVGWFKELKLVDEGMEGLIAWNDKGVELLESGQYKYFSPWISAYKNPETGREYANVFRGGALTNVPFLKMLPPIELVHHEGMSYKKAVEVNIKLSELEIHKGGNMNILEEIKKMLKVEKDEEVVSAFQEFFKTADKSEAALKEKDEAMRVLEEKVKEFETKIKELEEAKDKGAGGSGDKDKDVEAVKTQLKEVTESNKKLAEVLHVMKKDKIIGMALREAKIMPADADKWKKFYDQNPELIEEQIKTLPVLIELKEKGDYKANEHQGDTKLSDHDKEVAEQLGLTEEDYKENLDADLSKNQQKKEA